MPEKLNIHLHDCIEWKSQRKRKRKVARPEDDAEWRGRQLLNVQEKQNEQSVLREI